MSSCVNKICVSGVEIDSGGITVNGPLTVNTTSVITTGSIYNTNTLEYAIDSDYTIKNSDYRIIIVQEGSEDRYINLPHVNVSNGQQLIIKRLYPIMSYQFIIRPQIGDKIDNILNSIYPLDASHECVEMHCISSSWVVISSYGN